MKKIYIVILLLLIPVGLYSQNFSFGKVSEEEVLEKEHPLNKEADAAVLYRSHQVYYQVNSTGLVLLTEVHERIKIYNKDGFEWANKEILAYKNGNDREVVTKIKGATYNIKDGKLVEEKLRNGSIFEEEVNKYRIKTTLAMPDVKEGSVVEFRYTLRSPFVINIDDIALQYTIPINKLEAKIIVPEYLKFRRHFNPKSPIPFEVTKSRSTGYYHSPGAKVTYKEDVFSLSKNNIPALEEEAYVDYLKNYAAYFNMELQYTVFPDAMIEEFTHSWESVTKAVFDEGGYGKELKRTGFFEDDVDALLKGVVEPKAKAAAIYSFVKARVKWNEYFGFIAEKGLKNAYKEGEGNVGDINLLLTAMLQYAGLKAAPVLLSTPDNGIPLYPTRLGFNYVITGLELPDGLILMDATDKNAAMGELPKRARNWQGRIVFSKEESEWVDLMPKKKSISRSVINIKFKEDLQIKGKAADVLDGFYAKSFREDFGEINKEKYIQHLERNKGNISIANLETENEDKIGEAITQTFEFELKNGVELINDRLYVQPLLYEALEENPFKAEERKYPISFNFPSITKQVVNIMVPEGYEIESLPESLIADLNAGAGSFKYLVHQNGKFLRISSVLDLNNTYYTASDYEALKKFYGQIVDKQTEAIVFKKI